MIPAVAIVEQYPVLLDDINKMIIEYQAISITAGDTASYKEARAACTTLVHTRTAIEAKRKDLLRDYRDNVNQVADALLAPLTPVETRLKAELKAEDDRKATIKAELEAIEKKRVDAIKAAIFKLVNYANAQGKTSEQISKRIKAINAHEITEPTYQEFVAEAILAKATTLKTLRDALAEREMVEKEEAARKAEAERLEAVRLQQQAEQKRLDNEREAQAAKIKAEQDALAEERRKIKEEKAAIEAEKAAIEAAKQVKQDEAIKEAAITMRTQWKEEERAKQSMSEAAVEVKQSPEPQPSNTEDPVLQSLKEDQAALITYFNSLLAVPTPEIQDDAVKAVFSKFLDDLNRIMATITNVLS